jgi:hypothetical protein
VIDMANQPVLTSAWVSRANDAYAGWWLIMGSSSQNSLTIGDGAYIEWSHNDCTLRNGTTLRVTGQRTGGGPSMVIAPRFRIGNNGDSVPTATGTAIVENGYQVDPACPTRARAVEAIYGARLQGLIEIRDNGILELVKRGRHDRPAVRLCLGRPGRQQDRHQRQRPVAPHRRSGGDCPGRRHGHFSAKPD